MLRWHPLDPLSIGYQLKMISDDLIDALMITVLRCEIQDRDGDQV